MNKVKLLRLSKELTQVELANTIGVTEQTVINWEKGKTSPSKSMLALIAQTFNIDYDWLTGETKTVLATKEPETNDDVIAWYMSLSPEMRIWFKIELANRFPEFKAWLEEK